MNSAESNTTSSGRVRTWLRSPWAFALAFLIWGLAALLLIGPKHEQRQARLETKYNVSQQRLQKSAGSPSVDEQPNPFRHHPRDSVIPLTIFIAVLAVGVLVVLMGRRWWSEHKPFEPKDSPP